MFRILITLILTLTLITPILAEDGDHENVELLSTISGVGSSDICISGNYAYTTSGGLTIIDISDNMSPSIVLENFSDAERIDVVGNYAYLGTASLELQIVDVSDPVNPILMGSTNLYDIPNDVIVVDSYAYVSGYDGFSIIDVLDPENPFEVSWTADGNVVGNLYSIEVVEDFIYLIRGNGVALYSISDPASPQIVYGQFTGYLVSSASINGDFLYLTTGPEHLGRIVDISDPHVYEEVSSFTIPFEGQDITIDNGFAYIATHESGIVVVDVSVPHSPVTTGYYDTEQNMIVIDAFNDIAYASGQGTLNIFDCSQAVGVEEEEIQLPTQFSIINVYPNPFNPTLNVEIALPYSSDLNVKVYNLVGSEVANLTNGVRRAGYHNFVFDGSSLSSGVYFVHASVPGQLTQIQKVVLMK
jgi:hypothetical protein